MSMPIVGQQFMKPLLEYLAENWDTTPLIRKLALIRHILFWLEQENEYI